MAFYTKCEGPNVFSDQLTTAFIQGRAAQGVLDALDDDEFAEQCPDEVRDPRNPRVWLCVCRGGTRVAIPHTYAPPVPRPTFFST